MKRSKMLVFTSLLSVLSIADSVSQPMLVANTTNDYGGALVPVLDNSHVEKATTSSIPCPVCGSNDQQLVLNLGSQPFANDFQKSKIKALSSPRYPLKLVRCRVCNHFHLSHVASSKDLFEHYLYKSGTNLTIKKYFEWLAKKVFLESGSNPSGSVLELACNDGSQLDQFKKHHWKTFGVDPAVNIVPIATKKGHNVRAGFWPLEFKELPTGDNLTAIVAQNVFAHVPNPVDFLKACAAVMGPKTKLYVQTSQCNMQQLGQFDTVYHEHISFFTGHSFLRASSEAGLYITSFETTPIHGTSCLVTMELDPNHEQAQLVQLKGASNTNSALTRVQNSESLQQRLELEKEDGITLDFFSESYAARAHAIRDWIGGEVDRLTLEGYIVGAYGAAAKGMVLLNFILDGRNHAKNGNSCDAPWLHFVLDDAVLKQNTYCPGTCIPVLPTQSITETDPSKPLAILVFAWNFWDELAENLAASLKGIRSEVLAILPFPSPRVMMLNIETKEKLILHKMSPLTAPSQNLWNTLSQSSEGM